MATTIKLKNSVTTTNAPSSLVQGEVAINVTDKKVWVGNAATTPVQLLGTGADGSLSTLTVGAGTVSLPSITTTGDTNTGIFFPAADTIAFTEGGVESMRINSSGNLGLGTSSPSCRLDLNRGSAGLLANFTDGVNTNFQIETASLLATIGPSAGSTGMAFKTGNTERMRIDSSGNVGIGTSSPLVRLHVSTTGTSTSAFGNVISTFRSEASGRDASIQFSDGTNTGNIGQLSGNLILGTGGTERMRIDSSGNLLVGTTSAGIANTLSTTIETSGANNSRITVNHSSVAGSSNDSNYMQFGYGGNLIGRIVQASTTTVSYTTSSDYRLKENIEPMTGALDKVALLKPCTYVWKASGEASQGFIAHELAEVCPDAVNGEKDAVDEEGNIKPQGIDTSFLVATLTAALQEAHGLIKDLQARVDVLEGK
jgi:hypothetical protein